MQVYQQNKFIDKTRILFFFDTASFEARVLVALNKIISIQISWNLKNGFVSICSQLQRGLCNATSHHFLHTNITGRQNEQLYPRQSSDAILYASVSVYKVNSLEI